MTVAQFQTAGWVEASGPEAKVVTRNDLPIPQPREDEVLIKLEYSGVCRSDVARILGDKPLLVNIAGHEGVGVIVETGSEVPKHFTRGQRVGIGWMHNTCQTCEICQVDCTSCPKQNNTGRSVPGTFQQYMVSKTQFLARIPENLSSTAAAPLLCAGVTMFSAIRKANLRKGDWIVIPGAGGGLGHIGLQIANYFGYRTIAVDTGSKKREVCLRQGATSFLDFMSDNVEENVKSITSGLGSHAVICTAGSNNAYQQAFKLVRNTGTIVCIGLVSDKLPVTPFEVVVRGLHIVGSASGTPKDMDELMKLAATGVFAPVVEVRDFEDLDSIIQGISKDSFGGRIVVKLPQ